MNSSNNIAQGFLVYVRRRMSLFSNIDIHLRELLSGSSAAFALKVLGMAAGYFFTLLVTRNIGADAMGIFALSMTVLKIVSTVGKAGLDFALLRFVAEYASQSKWGLVKATYVKSLKVAFPLCLALSAMLFLASPYLAEHVFRKGYLTFYFRISSCAVLPMALVFINAQSLRGLKRIKEFAFLQHASFFLFPSIILVILLLFSEHKAIPVIAYVAGLVIVCALSHYLWRKNSGPKSTSTSNTTIKTSTLLSVSLPMLLASSINLVMHWTDTIMLGILRTEGEVGVYNVALKIAALTGITLFAVDSIAAPKLAEYYGKKDIEGFRKIVGYSSRLFFWTSVPILLALFLFPSFILGIFGESFTAGSDALLVLAVGQAVNAMAGPVGLLLIMTGKQKVHQNMILFAAVLNVLLNLVLIPKHGIIGAAIASMVSIAFWNIGEVIYVKSRYNVLTLYVPFLRRVPGGTFGKN